MITVEAYQNGGYVCRSRFASESQANDWMDAMRTMYRGVVFSITTRL